MRIFTLALPVIAGLFLAGLFSTATAQSTQQDYHTDKLYIKLTAQGFAQYQAGEDARTPLTKLLTAAGVESLSQRFPYAHPPTGRDPREVNLLTQLEVTLSAATDYRKALMQLNSRKQLIQYAELQPKYYLQSEFVPNDYDSTSMWHLNRVDAPRAWGITRGDTNTVLAILDNAIQWDHPDLVNRMKFNYADPIDGIDNDNNGFVDDFNGWDFAGDSVLFDEDNDPISSGGFVHGTEVSGFAMADANNGLGVVGTGGRCKFIPTKHSCENVGNAVLKGFSGIVYAANMGVEVINCSWGGSGNSLADQEVVDYAVINQNCAIVAAGGNAPAGTRSKTYPASYRGVLGVAIARSNDEFIGNCNCEIDLVSPGAGPTLSPVNGYASPSGGFSSFSSPMVAGATALVRSFFPNYSAEQAMQQVRVTADRDIYNLPANQQYAGLYGAGILNMYRALTIQSPAIRLSSYTYTDNNNSILQSGDTVNLTGIFRNLLQPTSSLQVTFQPDGSSASSITMLDATTFVGQVTTLGTKNNLADPFRFVIKDNIGDNLELSFTLTYTDGLYTDTECFTLIVNPTFANVVTNSIATSVNNKGNFGYNDYPNNNQGNGFIFDDYNYLFEGGVAFAIADTQVSDNLREQLGLGIASQDLVSTANIQVNDPGEKTDTEVTAHYDDSGAGTQAIGISVRDETYGTQDAPNDKFILKRLIVTNAEPQVISNLHVGVFADWDVGSDATDDSTDWNATEQMLYTWGDIQPSENAFVGMKFIDGTANLHAYSDDVVDFGYTDSMKYVAISSGVDSAAENGVDAMQALGFGPVELLPFASDTFVVAIVAGNSASDLFSNGQAALQHYNCIFKSTPLAVNLGPDQQACDSLTIDGTTPDAVSYQWDDNLSTPTRTISSSGNYELTVTNADGCAFSDVVNLQILSSPVAAAIASDTSVEAGNQPVFFSEEATGAVSFTWHTGDGYGFMGPNFSHIYQLPGTYTAQLIVSNGVCTDTSEVEIEVLSTSGINDAEMSQLRVYPNPVQNHLNIRLPANGKFDLRLFNTLGSMVASDVVRTTTSEKTHVLNMGELSAGVYWLQVLRGDKRAMFKLIKH